ncbi:HEPN domain-containing protein [Methylobacterium sp. EM32]|uniref:HEPN domain-containing protein n=1 Tax=Methylobacterium sp. EM32 TaxID=3163481 RepID=UPI0033BD1475
MLNAKARFNAALTSVRAQGLLYDHLVQNLAGTYNYDDILRFQIVFAVSAFDKLIHDLIRVGMVNSFKNARPHTPKYLSESISMGTHFSLSTASIPPAEYLFEQEIVKKLKTNSYQDPDKVSEGLSLIWIEKHKWQAIAGRMGIDQQTATTTLKLIAGRRNAIVHEADMDPIQHAPNTITKQEADNVINFIDLCGNSIVDLVI